MINKYSMSSKLGKMNIKPESVNTVSSTKELNRVYQLKDISTSTCFAPYDFIKKKFPLDSCLFKLTEERVYNFQKIVMMIHGSTKWIDYGYLICVEPGRYYQIDDIIWISPDEFQKNIMDLQEYYVFLKSFIRYYNPPTDRPVNLDVKFEMNMKNVYISVWDRRLIYRKLVDEFELCLERTLGPYWMLSREEREEEIKSQVFELSSLYCPKSFSSVCLSSYAEVKNSMLFYILKHTYHFIESPWFGYFEVPLRSGIEIKITNHEVNYFLNIINDASSKLNKLTSHNLYCQLNFEREIIGFLGHVRTDYDNQRRRDFLHQLKQIQI